MAVIGRMSTTTHSIIDFAPVLLFVDDNESSPSFRQTLAHQIDLLGIWVLLVRVALIKHDVM